MRKHICIRNKYERVYILHNKLLYISVGRHYKFLKKLDRHYNFKPPLFFLSFHLFIYKLCNCNQIKAWFLNYKMTCGLFQILNLSFFFFNCEYTLDTAHGTLELRNLFLCRSSVSKPHNPKIILLYILI